MTHEEQIHHDAMVLVGAGEAWLAMLFCSGLLGAALMGMRALLRRLHVQTVAG